MIDSYKLVYVEDIWPLLVYNILCTDVLRIWPFVSNGASQIEQKKTVEFRKLLDLIFDLF